jgi:hypothetical protein
MHENGIRQLMNSKLAENGAPVNDHETINPLLIPPPLSARLLTETRIPLAELQKIRLPDPPSESGLLRHELQSKGHSDTTEFADASPPAVLSSQVKPPAKVLLTQLAQRLTAVGAQIGVVQPSSAVRPHSTMTPAQAMAVFRASPLGLKLFE